jgi:hypothetical protein
LCKIVKKINSIYDTPQVFDVKISYSFKTKKYEYDHNGKIYAALKYIPKTFDQLVEDELIEMKTNKYIEQYSSIEGSCYSIIGTNIWCLFNNDDMYTGLIYDSSKDTIFGYYNTKTDTITKKYLNEKIFEFGYEGFHVTQYENKLIIQDLEKDVTITIDNWIYDISKTILLLKGQFDKNLKVKMTAFGKNNMYMLYDYLYINNMYICRFSFSLKQLRTYYETMKNGYLGNPTYRY